MAIFKKKQGEELSFPEFPDGKYKPGLPLFKPKDFPSLKEIKDAVKPLNTSKEPARLEPLQKLDLPKLTETMTYEPKKEVIDSKFAPSQFNPLPKEPILDIPVRQKPIPTARPAEPRLMQMNQGMHKQMPMQRPAQRPMQYHQTKQQPMAFDMPRASGKPLFVQIDEYNKIIETVNNLKLSIQEAERTLASLKQLKERENEELSRWDDHLNRVKEKLLSIDKRLFES